ncbi:hypothetical protein B566_EDAN008062 [Ephemera danica]|nr:hypothetical protein B566_EDAN008062 [Ephemera danica]
MEGAKIYSLKWYRGRHEFYRYLPQESPPLNRIFPFPGISVDMLESKVKYCYEYEFQNDSRYECDFATMAGQLLNANCTTVKSRPAANLTFYINDVPVSEEYLEHSDKEMASTVGSWLSVRAPVPQQAGPLRLKCVASVLIFNLHTDIMLEEERPQLLVLSAREQDSSSRASWQKGGLFQVSNVFPFIILWIIDQVRCLHIGQQGL